MTAVKAGDVERVLRSRPAGIDVLLFYGPDAGLVAERGRRAAAAVVPDPTDGLQLIRLDGDQLAEQPGRLVEEATSFGLFGGLRAIRVKVASRDVSGAVASYLDAPLTDTLVVIEAGDLKPSSPLRKICEASRRALALPCYADEARDLGGLIDDVLAHEGVTIDRDARAVLIDSLGGDRLASRGELTKLALYCGTTGRVTLDDVEAVVSDVSSLSLDAALDASFAGDLPALDAAVVQSAQHGVAPAAALSMAIRHVLGLAAARAEVDGGRDVETAMRSLRGLPYRRQPAVKRQLADWTAARLTAALEILQGTALEIRRQPSLGTALLWAAFGRIAGLAPRSSSRRAV